MVIELLAANTFIPPTVPGLDMITILYGLITGQVHQDLWDGKLSLR